MKKHAFLIALALSGVVISQKAAAEDLPVPHQLVMLSYVLGNPQAGVGPVNSTVLSKFDNAEECKKAASSSISVFTSWNPNGNAGERLAVLFMCIPAGDAK